MKEAARGITVLVSAFVLLAGLAAAAEAANDTAAAEALAKGVLKHVPADCMGFVVVKNVQAAGGKLEAFVKAVKPAMGQPGQAQEEPPLLDMLLAGTGMGEGFDRAGGVAIVLFDGKKYPTPKPAGEESDSPFDLSIAFLLPGKGPQGVLARLQWREDDNVKGLFSAVKGAETHYARQVANYVAVSESPKALGALAATEKSVLEKLVPAEKTFIASNDVAGWLGASAVSTFFEAMQKAAEAARDESGGPGGQEFPAALMTKQWKMLFGAEGAVCAGGQFGADGLKINVRMRTDPDSFVGKSLAAFKPRSRRLLNRLPNLQYALAGGMLDVPSHDRKVAEEQMDLMMKGFGFEDLPEETKQQYKKIMLGLDEQVLGVQFVAGPVTRGQGKVAMACVMECKSAAETRKLLKDAAPVITELVKRSAEEPFKGMAVRYELAGEGASEAIDTLTFVIPEMEEGMSDEDRRKMVAVLGTDKIQFLVKQVDDKSLVMTFGGGAEFLALAAKSASGGATLADNPAIARALATMPANRLSVFFLDVANTWDVVKKIAETCGAEEMPPLKLDTHVPIMGVAWMDGADVCGRIEFPTEPVKQVVQAFIDFQMFMMQKMMRQQEQLGGGEAGPPPPGDF